MALYESESDEQGYSSLVFCNDTSLLIEGWSPFQVKSGSYANHLPSNGRMSPSKGFQKGQLQEVEWQVNSDPQINFVSLYIKGVQDLFNLK